MKSKPYKYSFKMMSEFTSPQLFELIQRNRSLSNTIECMQRYDTLEHHLSFLSWEFFSTITYKNPKDKEECRILMNELYEEIESRSSGDTRMFYTTENFSVSNGNHNHFVLKSDMKLYQIRDLMKELESVGIIDIQRYDMELAAIFYICKEVKNNQNGLYWDLLGNNLEEDGELIKKYKKCNQFITTKAKQLVG
ncbi:hypothetical protein [Aestuariivivens sediminis]|uniref:hypothetical protein n=1 Tax=Aestuariivivens sediminis TaxID=2913557 RepID=UPI001F5606D9|nr:hypothetical protein [Aestuariivivens sediminis]